MMKRIFLLLATAFMICPILQAQTWTGAISTAWNTAGNWNTNAVPLTTGNVVIPNTVNKPALPANTTVASFNMQAGSGLNFNGFSLSVTGASNIAGAVMSNTNPSTDIVLNLATGGGNSLNYIGGTTFSDHSTISFNGTGNSYEGYTNGNSFLADANFVISGTGYLYTSYNQKSSFSGNHSITRTVAGTTDLFNTGFNFITGNFSYINNAGGSSYINGGNILSGNIGGTINITVSGSGNPIFQMRRIKNLINGGNISVQNTGNTLIENDTLMVNSMVVSGFAASGTDEMSGNVITGNLTFADGPTNSGSVYFGANTVNGTTTLASNFTATWYEGYGAGNNLNGNTFFNLNGSGRFYSSYNAKSSFTGHLSVTRTAVGITDLFNTGFNFITGNFDYSNLAGGDNLINGSGAISGSIGGTVAINVAGTGNPAFQLRRIKNLSNGGSISVQNCGVATVLNDTLLVNSLQITGFTGSGGDDFSDNVITGDVTLAEAATNTGQVYVGNNTITGNTVLQTNFSATWYEGYSSGNTFIGNTSFNVAGTGTFYSSYNQKSSFTGNLAVNRTGSGLTELFRTGLGFVTGNFSYSNNAGGNSFINGGNVQSGPINGTLNISIAGSGSQTVQIFRIKNLTPGGTVSITNTGTTSLRNDTLVLASLNVSGFSGASGDELMLCDIVGNVTFADAVTNSGTVYVGANSITGNTQLIHNSSATWYESFSAGNNFKGPVSLIRSGIGALNLAYNDTLHAYGNVQLNSNSGLSVSFPVEFLGSDPVTLEQLGTQPISLPRLVMSKNAEGSLTLLDSLTITTSVRFGGGHIFTAAGNELIFAPSSSYTGASASSHVFGPIIKAGAQAFVFPVGGPTTLNTVAMSAPVGAASRFSTEYKNQNPGSDGFNTALKAGSFGAASISQAGYWDVKRLTGTTNVTLSLGFGSNPYEQYPSLAALKVAHWNGAQWDDYGNGGTTGTAADGTIVNATAITSFSPFTLAGGASTYFYVYGTPGAGPDGTPVKFSGTGGYSPYQTKELPAGTYSADSIYLVPNGTSAGFKLKDAYGVEKNDTSVTVAAAPTTYIAANGNGSVNFSGWRHYVYVTNGSNQIIGAIKDNNLTLGNTTITAYFSSGNVAAAPNGNVYLKRSFKITSQFAPAGIRRVRFYILKSEYNNLVAADPASFPNGINSLTITRYTGPQEDSLFNPMPGSNSVIIPYSDISIADMGTMYSLDVDVPSFSTFYIGGNQARVSLCGGASISIPSNLTGATYQWQVNTGSGFTNLSNGGVYSGVGTRTLTLNNVPSSYYGYQYRAFVNGNTYSQVFTTVFTATWQGTSNNVWENPANWSCGILPDANTDVLINAGKPNYPQLGTNTSVRTLRIATAATASVKPGFTLTVTK